ncbi:hypothetical protein BD410DRAFT_531038 [Rickenella mellea]|uniref:Uncharacterized protein n=1 Tax=Rickenella mellea TaxID=50990 RepID=A0A4Y7QG92_9AGAM|nr:hypothetical protein BD410DRAFT_531038 [Rickenella mellea]
MAVRNEPVKERKAAAKTAIRTAAEREPNSKHRTHEDRQKLLEGDELLDVVEPESVHCIPCDKWIKLQTARGERYNLSNWKGHKEACHSGTAKSGVPRTSREERRKLLQEDKLLGIVEEERVHCIPCKKWISLQKGNHYTLVSWTRHKKLCHPDVDKIVVNPITGIIEID